MFSPASLTFEHLFPYEYPHLECSSSNNSCQFIFHCDVHRRTQIRFEGRWVHGHSGSVYLVSFRTQKSSLPASIPLLWYESPRERKSLCPSSFTFGSSSNLTSVGAWPVTPSGVPAFFAFNRLIKHTRQHPKRGHHHANRYRRHIW